MTSTTESGPIVAPVIEHPVTVTFQGDWGQANMHRICGWLAQEMGDRSPDGSRFGTWNGRGGADAFEAVLDGTVDIAIATPTAAAAALASGMGPLHLAGSDRLRTLGTLPQRDRLVVAVDAALGVSSIEDLAGRASDLRIATSPDDGVNLVGLAAHELLRAEGIDLETFTAQGATFSYHERPFPAIAEFARGEANVLIHEAIMLPAWQRITEVCDVAYLPISEKAAAAFADWSWPTATVSAGDLPMLETDLTTLEFSDFLLLCRDDLRDDVAGLAAWCMIATRGALEAQYQHIPGDRSPLNHPLVPASIRSTVIPLHAAAAASYELVGEYATTDAQIWS